MKDVGLQVWFLVIYPTVNKKNTTTFVEGLPDKEPPDSCLTILCRSREGKKAGKPLLVHYFPKQEGGYWVGILVYDKER